MTVESLDPREELAIWRMIERRLEESAREAPLTRRQADQLLAALPTKRTEEDAAAWAQRVFHSGLDAGGQSMTRYTAQSAPLVTGTLATVARISNVSGSVLWQTERPVLVLIDEVSPDRTICKGWLASADVDLASSWDVLVEAGDWPIHPLAGMIEIDKPVRVPGEQVSGLVGDLPTALLPALRTVADVLARKGEPGWIMSREGHRLRRRCGSYLITTGTPLSGPDDPRRALQSARHALAEQINGATSRLYPETQPVRGRSAGLPPRDIFTALAADDDDRAPSYPSKEGYYLIAYQPSFSGDSVRYLLTIHRLPEEFDYHTKVPILIDGDGNHIELKPLSGNRWRSPDIPGGLKEPFEVEWREADEGNGD